MSLSAYDLEGARRHVTAVGNFWYHLMTYVVVNAMLVVTDIGRGDWRVLGLGWAFWVILIWGFGVVGHAISVLFGEGRVQGVAARGPTTQRWVIVAIVGLVLSVVHPTIAQEARRRPRSRPATRSQE